MGNVKRRGEVVVVAAGGGVGWGEYFKAGQRVCLPRRASRYQRKSEKNKSTEGYDPAD